MKMVLEGKIKYLLMYEIYNNKKYSSLSLIKNNCRQKSGCRNIKYTFFFFFFVFFKLYIIYNLPKRIISICYIKMKKMTDIITETEDAVNGAFSIKIELKIRPRLKLMKLPFN